MDFTLAAAKIGIAALCGGFIRLLFRPANGWKQYAYVLASCLMVGVIATGPTMTFFDIQSGYTVFIAAGWGLFGLSVAQSVLHALDKLDLSGWLQKRVDP